MNFPSVRKIAVELFDLKHCFSKKIDKSVVKYQFHILDMIFYPHSLDADSKFDRAAISFIAQ